MTKKQPKYINLKDWELPALDELEENLVRDLARKKLAIYLDEETLGRELHTLIFDRVRKLAQTAVNEAITYWLQGLGDGNEAQFPELCVEFPYWELHDENVEPLTIAYNVDNQDGTRTQLNRIDLAKALMRVVCSEDRGASTAQRISVMAGELRNLANRLDSAAKAAAPDRTLVKGTPNQ
jgi:hypothetical protein